VDSSATNRPAWSVNTRRTLTGTPANSPSTASMGWGSPSRRAGPLPARRVRSVITRCNWTGRRGGAAPVSPSAAAPAVSSVARVSAVSSVVRVSASNWPRLRGSPAARAASARWVRHFHTATPSRSGSSAESRVMPSATGLSETVRAVAASSNRAMVPWGSRR